MKKIVKRIVAFLITLVLVANFIISNSSLTELNTNLFKEAKACTLVGETGSGDQMWCNCSYDERCQLEVAGGWIYWDDAPARLEY